MSGPAQASARPLRIIVHGGAWSIPDELKAPNLAACNAAADAGWAVLAQGGSAVDAVEAAVRCLEDDPSCDAGRGSWLTAGGDVELDAMIMDGGTPLQAGGVAAVCVAHPVSLARKVMEQSEHVLLVGEGAMAFGDQHGIPRATREELVTPAALEEWRRYGEYDGAVRGIFRARPQDPAGPARRGHDTVGAVALDAAGRLACATSTGGVSLKLAGRVGDSPIVGAGGYCDNEVGGCSATGHGEAILKVALCRHATWLLEGGLAPDAAAEAALEHMRRKCGGGPSGGATGGLIMLARDGRFGKAFTSERMVWASREGDAEASAGGGAPAAARSGIEPADVGR